MKQNYWLFLAALAVMGLLFVPGQAHSAEFLVPAVPVSFNVPVMPAILPTITVPGPRPGGINKPQIQLPSPSNPIPMSLPAAVAPRPLYLPGALPVRRSVALLPAARKALGAKTLDSRTLDKAFDNVELPVEVPPVVVPQYPDPSRQTLPETDLEREIGIQ